MATIRLPALSYANRFPERILVDSPLPLFNGNGLTLPSPPASTCCLEPVSRNDLSLARNDCPASDHHSEVNAPGLLLRSPAEPFSSPCDLSLHRLPQFRTATSGFTARDPLPERPTQQSRFLLKSPLPVEAVVSPLDRSVQPDLVPGKPAFR